MTRVPPKSPISMFEVMSMTFARLPAAALLLAALTGTSVSAQIAIAGVDPVIPVDQCVLALAEVGQAMETRYKDTALGALEADRLVHVRLLSTAGQSVELALEARLGKKTGILTIGTSPPGCPFQPLVMS